MPYVYPTSRLQYLAAVVGGLLFCFAVIAKRLSTPKSTEPASARCGLSIVGITIQSASFFVAAAAAPVKFSPGNSSRSWLLAALIFCLAGAGALLFHCSARALGENWRLVARTRLGHQLVRNGPFARMRHPIYLSLLLMLATLGIGLGHVVGLTAAIPLFLFGTNIRTREEERLLRKVG